MQPSQMDKGQGRTILIVVISLVAIYVHPCCAEQSDPFSLDSLPSLEEEQLLKTRESPEHSISIEKEIYPEKDYYMPNESFKITTIIKFIKYKNLGWTPENIEAYELIDENLELRNEPIKCKLYYNPFNKIDIKNSTNITKEGFYINMPEKIRSNQTIVYEYNVTVEKTGSFTAKTVVVSGNNVYADTEKTLKIHVSNFDFLSPYIEVIKEIIWILIVLSGLFTAYRGIVEKPTRKYHLKNVFSDIIDEYISIIKSLPYRYILVLSSMLMSLELYSYFSLQDPKSYPPLSLGAVAK
jgi:hypothetical protein